MTIVVLLVTLFVRGGLVVETDKGFVKGQPASSIFSSYGNEYLGIPYGEPPLGSLRFQPSMEKQSNFSGVFQATKYGPACMQPGESSGKVKSEDCLTLDVFTPVWANSSSSMPVMVFYYGGSWRHGSTQNPIYRGGNIIRSGIPVLVVTVNYRLGPFGFLAGSALKAARKDGSLGNMGLMDQQLALKWVQRNIKAFGGDPGRVMIFGESAGAGSVSAHLTIPSTQGLFHTAIMESGPMAHWTVRSLETAQTQFDIFVKEVGCEGDDVLQCLLDKPAEALVGINVRVPQYYTRWSPVVDKVFLPEDPSAAAKKGRVFNGTVLLGVNQNEGTAFSKNVSKTLNESEYHDVILRRFGPAAYDRLKDLYPLTDYKNSFYAAAKMITDRDFNCAALRTARWIREAGGTAFVYQFNHLLHEIALVYSEMGVFHGAELLFVWNLPSGFYPIPGVPADIPIVFTPSESTLQRKMVDYWTSVASHGTPNGPNHSNLHWPAYEENTQEIMDLDLKLSTKSFLRKVYCEYWDSIFDSI